MGEVGQVAAGVFIGWGSQAGRKGRKVSGQFVVCSLELKF